ncbi:MAG: serine/threonine protein kinase [Planctomycetes bacterium]|nr:serine/threonine protein kinase [Planctomycetota bacterium]
MTSPSLLQDPLLRPVPTLEGHKVLGKTVLLERLGEGGAGVVYRGWHLNFRIVVAVKVLRPELAADADYVARFHREAHATLQITHQNVVRAHDLEERDGLHFLVMEYVDGLSARQWIHRRGRMSVDQALTALAGAAAGLAEAHTHGLVHQDVKPSNLLLARSGRVKVADLGLVGPAVDSDDEAAAAARRRVFGTPQYMAPEQWDGAPPQPSADVWALGACAYYLLTGRHGLPKVAKGELRRLVRQEPFPTIGGVVRARPGFGDLLERCVDRDPARRFTDATALHQALLALGGVDEALLRDPDFAPGGEPVGLPANEVLARIDDQRRRRPGPAAVSAAAAPRPKVRAAPARSSAAPIVVVVLLVAAAVIVVLLRSQG